MKTRDSNMELLRLICMFLIVFQHCIHLCAFPEVWNLDVFSGNVCVAAILTGFAYISVNCFVLISGYYGIKPKIRFVVNIYLICAFYALMGYLLHLCIDGTSIGKGVLYHSFLCISHSKLWFVKCYFGLMLLSPLLNAAIQNMQKKTYRWILVLMTVLNVYFGFIWQDDVFNANGYTIANFVYIYMIGAYISRYVDIDWCCKHRIGNTIVYTMTSLLWAGSIVFQRFVQTPWDEWGYNNPFTLIGAVSFFLLFVSIPKFYNRWINGMAAGTFAVYVVHCGDYFGGWFCQYVGQVAEWLRSDYGMGVTVFGMLIVALIIELIICCLDKLRNVAMQPVVEKVSAVIESLLHTHTTQNEDNNLCIH